MSGKMNYAYLDDSPVAFDDTKAVIHHKSGWAHLHMADAMSKARLITRKEFDAYCAAAGATDPSTLFH